MRKNAVITGGTKGIGRALSELFASKGFHILTCSRSAEDLAELRLALGSYDVEISVFRADFASRKEVEAFGLFVLQSCDHVDILINNAGIFRPGSVLTEDEENLDLMWRVNVESVYWLTRLLAPTMTKARNGHIVNLCSIASQVAYPNGGSYSISKFALLGYTKVLREELKGEGVRVTAVLPGATWSDSWKGVDLPEERLMQASDIAQAIWSAHQLSDAAVVEEIVIRPQLGDL